MKNKRNILARFISDNKAVAFLEFAIVLPFLLLLAFGSIELARYASFKQKTESAATNITNLINQTRKDDLKEATLDYITAVFPEAIKPYTSEDWEVIITAVYHANGVDCDTYSLWQVGKGYTDYTPNRVSQVANGENKIATIANYKNKLQNNDQLVTVELFINYKPLIDSSITSAIGLGKKEIHSLFVSRPRYGAFMKHPITRAEITPVCKLTDVK